jgi:hypothetical protein
MDDGHASNITKFGGKKRKKKTLEKRRMQWNANPEQSTYIGFVT